MSHKNKTGNVDVFLEIPKNKDTPQCSHGPTLLFGRRVPGSEDVRQFYACSACRDRKECAFFHWADNKMTPQQRKFWHGQVNASKPQWSHEELYERFCDVRKLPAESRILCVTCGLLVKPTDMGSHRQHLIDTHLTDAQLQRPTLLLAPRTNNKVNAQYLFSEKTVDFLVSTMKQQGVTHVLGLGTPRIHEELLTQQQQDKGLPSMLLDMDHRLGHFFPPHSLCRYNMFNHHFLEGQSCRQAYLNFLRHDDLSGRHLALVLDPPFGGLVSVLANTIKQIMEEYLATGRDDKITILWIFPFYHGSYITNAMPSLHMADYRVTYTNHRKMKDTGATKLPVRVFTNIIPVELIMPTSDGYRLCAKCKKYVFNTNKHCDKCGECTSRGGQVLRHCDDCRRCVKPQTVHCVSCCWCVRQPHECKGGHPRPCADTEQLGHKKKSADHTKRKRSKQPSSGKTAEESSLKSKRRRKNRR